MATYQIQINERTSLGKGVLSFLQSIPQVVTFQIGKEERELTYEEVVNKSELHRSLDRAFKDVRLMLDGKKQEKTLDELIYELQNSND